MKKEKLLVWFPVEINGVFARRIRYLKEDLITAEPYFHTIGQLFFKTRMQ